MNDRTFSQNLRKRGKSHHHHDHHRSGGEHWTELFSRMKMKSVSDESVSGKVEKKKKNPRAVGHGEEKRTFFFPIAPVKCDRRQARNPRQEDTNFSQIINKDILLLLVITVIII